MKFKRMISAVVSAAIAVTSLSVCMTTGVSAVELELDSVVNFNVSGTVGWSAPDSNAKVDSSVSSAYSEYADKGILVVSFTSGGGQTIMCGTNEYNDCVWYNAGDYTVVYPFTSTYATDGFYMRGDGITVNSIYLYPSEVVDFAVSGTVGWSAPDSNAKVDASVTSEYSDYVDNSVLVVEFTSGGGQTIMCGTNEYNDCVWYNAGDYTVVFPFTSTYATDGFYMRGDGITVNSIKLYGPVEKSGTPVTGVSLDKETLEFALGSDGFNAASKAITATVEPAEATEKTVKWTSSDEAVATVADGVVTPVGIGKATITATTKDGGMTDTCEVTVKPVAATNVTIGASTNAVEGGDKVALDVEITPANALDKTVKFTSSDETVATVDAEGNVSFAMVEEEKTVDITAATTYTNADFDIAPVSDTITFTVTPKDVSVPVTGVTLDKTEVSVAKGETVTLTETVTPADADVKTVSWSSSDEKVATVLNGVVTAVEQGTATITVKTADGGFTAECKVTVTAPKAEDVTVLINGEEIKDDKFSMMNGRTRKISATVAPEDAVQDVTYTVADPAIVSVENGVVTAKAEGTTTITATADGASKVITVEVTAKSNVPYTTEEGIVIFDGKGTSSGWGQAVVMYEYDKGDGPFRISDIKEGMKFKVYYASSAAPELIFQSWSGGTGWAKIAAASSADGVAVYTYDDIVKAYGSSDFSTLDAINVGDTGAALSVTKVVMVYSEDDPGEDPVEDPDPGEDPGDKPTPPTPPTPSYSNDEDDDDADEDDDEYTDEIIDIIDDEDDDDVLDIVGIPVTITTFDADEELENAAKGIGEILVMFNIDTGTANPKGEFDACIGTEFAGKTIDLYKYNEETGELEFVGTFDVDENGFIKMYYNGSADYVAFESAVNGSADKGEGNPVTGVQTTAGVVGLIAAAASAALFISAKKKEN